MYGRGYQGAGLGFGPPVTPPVVKQLLIANFAVFAVQILMQGSQGGGGLVEIGAVRATTFWSGWLWQPFTYMFLHGGLGHVAMNMLALWMFGSPLALVWGDRRFLRYYLGCGVGAGLLIATLPYVAQGLGLYFRQLDPAIPTLGASGAVYGVLLAYSLTWPNRTIMLIFPPVAFRAIWLIPLLFLMEFYFGAGNVSHVGHLGGVLVGWLWLQRGSGGGKGLLGVPSLEQLRWRWRRFRMRRRLRAVRREEHDWRRRASSDDDRTLH